MAIVDLEKLKELEAKATPAPWHAPGLGEIHALNHLSVAEIMGHDPNLAEDDQMGCGTDEDAEFIVAIRNAAPALVRRVERYEKAFDEIKEICVEAPSLVVKEIVIEQIIRNALKEETNGDR